ncbi:SMR family transporter [Beijerinckia sp. L45]|uniref:SMR family transporter n=1 Tax=Beijerinckia sp. L45 TaxID=1641855 RepID=UPI001AEE6B18|nr:SMR family transporter [Beijerinckia sp. L45]
MSPRFGILGLILLSVGLNAAAQLFLRVAMRGGLPTGLSPLAMVLDVGTRPGVIGGLGCYGLSLLLWIYVLSKADASFAYPFLGLGFAVVTVAGCTLLGEPVSMPKILGILIIAAGVVVLAGGG